MNFPQIQLRLMQGIMCMEAVTFATPNVEHTHVWEGKRMEVTSRLGVPEIAVLKPFTYKIKRNIIEAN